MHACCTFRKDLPVWYACHHCIGSPLKVYACRVLLNHNCNPQVFTALLDTVDTPSGQEAAQDAPRGMMTMYVDSRSGQAWVIGAVSNIQNLTAVTLNAVSSMVTLHKMQTWLGVSHAAPIARCCLDMCGILQAAKKGYCMD